ncbi:MAG: glycosyltransferase [Saprospiraceae bacterium]|nr:glycosyltransferase [Saprospiraceae bacterium]
MGFVLQLFLYISLFLLISSYLLFPLTLYILYSIKERRNINNNTSTFFPHVSCLISIYNEEKIIESKILSLLHQNYPQDKIQIYIGSDASTDKSTEIIKKLADLYKCIKLVEYPIRRGKTAVVNDLVQYIAQHRELNNDHIILFTDANVILGENTIHNLCMNFAKPSIGLVDSNILPQSIHSSQIGDTEKEYIKLETKLKYWEGQLWGCMMGTFGGCYAVRSDLVPILPANLMVDDFYISMKVLENGKYSINAMDAVAYETIPGNMTEEIKRKSRISIGNFQNLSHFRHFLYRKPIQRAFCFLFHKVLRWIGPLLILIAWSCSFLLTFTHYPIYKILFISFSGIFFLIPSLERLLNFFNIQITILSTISYFSIMNFALLKGFISYCQGVKNGIWQPTQRNL